MDAAKHGPLGFGPAGSPARTVTIPLSIARYPNLPHQAVYPILTLTPVCPYDLCGRSAHDKLLTFHAFRAAPRFGFWSNLVLVLAYRKNLYLRPFYSHQSRMGYARGLENRFQKRPLQSPLTAKLTFLVLDSCILRIENGDLLT